MNEDQKPTDQKPPAPLPPKQAFTFLFGLGIIAHITAYIAGPMLLLGGLGWWLDGRYGRKYFTLIGLFIAFITSNYLVFRKSRDLVDLK